MKRKVIIYLALVLTLMIGSFSTGSVQAQEQSLEATLAESAGKGFLISLVRPELSFTRDFYLLDSVNADGIVNELGTVNSYQITTADWADDDSYQITATVQPSNREVVIFTGKYNGRWRVERLELAAAVGTGAAIATDTTPSGLVPVEGNGSGLLIIQNQSGGDFYTINADGTNLQYVSQGIDPQLSPDGTKIAFTRWAPKYELFTINVDGTGEQAWVSNFRQMKSPTWSADGSAITFSYQDGGRLDTEERRINLLKAALNEDGIDIPSNARAIEVENGILEYVIPPDAFWFLKRIDLSTGELQDLITERHSYAPTAHPVQSDLVAYKGIAGIAINNATTNLDQGVSTDPNDRTPIISPDGTKVAVTYWQNGHWEIHTMNIDGTNRQRLTTTPLYVIVERGGVEEKEVDGAIRLVPKENPWWNNAAPVWSPDGSQIAFMSDRSGEWNIWIMNADGSKQRPMFPNGAVDDIEFTYNSVDERMLSWR